ncbi:FGGY family carbohydrate kinase [Microbacterium elymi]|uniref:FGGY family carbohydrate kinase n=1 Tax=Microbacterium elymi TaxID=2909587 RepID=A0ABY5NIU1_9MICO|nr:FGGY family carbohydrate kinase [Microbacterium elymi]UUT35049.1 FGGY family carbohydrate kinase [Microbacterium elymi]
MSIVLGIDLATAEVRVQAVDVESGQAVAERRAALPVREAGPGGERVQPAEHTTLARALIAAVAADLGARASQVRALSITGTSGTVVPADAAGRPVGDAVLYDDPRGADGLRRLAAVGWTRRPMGALARAAWMHVVAPAERYLFTPDIVAAALAGRLLLGHVARAQERRRPGHGALGRGRPRAARPAARADARAGPARHGDRRGRRPRPPRRARAGSSSSPA